MNIKLASIVALTSLLLAGSAMAQGNGNPGAHFIENWDQDGDGVVTLAEVTQKRGEVFYMFDQDEDGMLSAEEYVMFDETREADMAMEAEQQGNGGGNGKNGGQGNNGNGGGKNGGGGGHGNSSNGGGQQGGEHRGAEGMSLEFNDMDGDGQVSEEEFLTSAKAWFVTMDRNGDGEISTADFGHQ